jgi:Holliday junction resolvasome RuvABC DNA-binding subunit
MGSSMEDLRKVVKDTCKRLFPEVKDQVTQTAQGEEDNDSSSEELDLSYNQRLNKQFNALLDQLGTATPQATTQLQHIEEEMALAL